MDLIDFLKQEHGRVNKLLERLSDTSEGAVKTRQRLGEQVKTELELHARLEERHLYPVLKKIDETKDRVGEAIEEHREYLNLARQLARMNVQGEGFLEKVKELTGIVSHHVREEEDEIIPQAEKAIGREEREELVRKIQEAKKAAMQKA